MYIPNDSPHILKLENKSPFEMAKDLTKKGLEKDTYLRRTTAEAEYGIARYHTCILTYPRKVDKLL